MKRLKFKIFKFEARIARNSELLRRFAPTVGALGDEEVGHFGLNVFIHDLISGSLAISPCPPERGWKGGF
jgi:hypothetical protein